MDRPQVRNQHRLGRLLRVLWHDLRFALRRLRYSPVFTGFAIVSLAVGVGATSAVYSLMQTMIWPETGVRDEARVVLVGGRDESGDLRWQQFMSRADFADLARQQTSLMAVAASASIAHPLIADAVAAFQSGEAVTGAYFDVLGVAPLHGRTLGPADDTPAAPNVLVISESFWRRKLESDPAVLGRVVQYGGHPFQIVGVAGAGFGGLEKLEGPQRRSDIWISLAAAERIGARTFPLESDRDQRRLAVVGRLVDGQPVERTTAEVAAIAARLDQAFPYRRTTPAGAVMPNPRDWAARTVADARAVPAGVNAIAGAVIGIVALVLVVASTNLANLTLARGSGRATELAVRRALGASRGRLVVELVAESALVGLAGGIAALWIASALVTGIAGGISLAGVTMLERFDPRLDWRVFLFASAAALLAFVVSGLIPALRLTRQERSGTIGKPGDGAAAVRWGGPRRLIVAQVAISTALFLMAAVGVAMVSAHADDPGIDIDRVAIASVILRGPAWTESRTRASLDEIVAAVSREPGIEAAAAAFGLQLGPRGASFATVAPAGSEPDTKAGGHDVYFIPASSRLLAALGVPIVRGRTLNDGDTPASPPVAVVSEHAARLLFGTTDVVSREIVWRGALNMPEARTIGRLTIVGVARDTMTGRRRTEGRDGVLYVPAAQQRLTPVPPLVIVRHRPDIDGRAAAMILQTAIRRVAPDAPVSGSGDGAQMLAEELQVWRTVSRIAVGLGACALLLTLVGLYGVLAHLVARRSREMGVRLALGAAPRQLLLLVLREGLRPVAIGIAIGLGVGILLRLGARSVFVDAPPANDPLVFAIVSTALLAAGALACALPARRAAGVDPNVALRDL